MEFIRIFLNEFNTEFNNNKNNNIYKEFIPDISKSKEIQNEEFHKFFLKKENSMIIDIFYSQLITSYICKCTYIHYSLEKLLEIPLQIPKKDNIDLYDLLNIHFKCEFVEFEEICKNCRKKVIHQKLSKISTAPDIIILVLLRIDNETNIKNECIISFPDNLDFSNYVDNNCVKFPPVYKLYGTINHIGSFNLGHYYCYINTTNDNKWYKFDDSKVIEIGENIENTNVYALFYTKI